MSPLRRWAWNAADTEVFYITEHDANYPMILIDLTRVRWDVMPGLLEQAWRLVAPARLVKAYDAALADSN